MSDPSTGLRAGLPARLCDAYGHVALPRFLSGDEYLKVMDRNRVSQALVCTAETCPDLVELSRTAVAWPDRFRVAGLPTGRNRDEWLESARAQIEAGFVGLRLHEGHVLKAPELMDYLGREGAIAFVHGSNALEPALPQLARFLERWPDALVLAIHFASGGDPSILGRNAALESLFRHPRFAVVFSRQGAFRDGPLREWARAVVERTGWERVMWGSEYPVAMYRGESYSSTATWIDESGLDPTPEQRDAYLFGNARRLIFSRPVRPPKLLDPGWCRFDLKDEQPVWLFPNGTIDISEETNRRLVEAYLRGGESVFGSYRGFLAAVIGEGALRIEERRAGDLRERTEGPEPPVR